MKVIYEFRTPENIKITQKKQLSSFFADLCHYLKKFNVNNTKSVSDNILLNYITGIKFYGRIKVNAKRSHP